MAKRFSAIRLIERKLFTILVSMVVVLAGLYGYFVSKSIVDVLVREEIEQKITLLNSRLGDLEFSYITKQGEVDRSLAHALGLVEVERKTFVTRRSALSQNLTLDSGDRIR